MDKFLRTPRRVLAPLHEAAIRLLAGTKALIEDGLLDVVVDKDAERCCCRLQGRRGGIDNVELDLGEVLLRGVAVQSLANNVVVRVRAERFVTVFLFMYRVGGALRDHSLLGQVSLAHVIIRARERAGQEVLEEAVTGGHIGELDARPTFPGDPLAQLLARVEEFIAAHDGDAEAPGVGHTWAVQDLLFGAEVATDEQKIGAVGAGDNTTGTQTTPCGLDAALDGRALLPREVAETELWVIAKQEDKAQILEPLRRVDGGSSSSRGCGHRLLDLGTAAVVRGFVQVAVLGLLAVIWLHRYLLDKRGGK
eukprot:PhM_4_TR5741/c0_g1_i1/m.86993